MSRVHSGQGAVILTEQTEKPVLVWKRIEDAPQDGTVIYTHDGAYPVIAAWCCWPKYTTKRTGPWWNRKSERVEDGVTEGWYTVSFPFGQPTAGERIYPRVWRVLPPLPWDGAVAAISDDTQPGTKDEVRSEPNPTETGRMEP